MNNSILLLISLFIVKHFIVDFLIQPSWMYLNKGKYGNVLGMVHSYFHGFVTFWILSWFTNWQLAVGWGLLEAVIHYHIDWAKVNINKLKFKKYVFGYNQNAKHFSPRTHRLAEVFAKRKLYIIEKKEWLPNTSEWYWYLLGLDQFLHYMTYVLIIYLVMPPAYIVVQPVVFSSCF